MHTAVDHNDGILASEHPRYFLIQVIQCIAVLAEYNDLPHTSACVMHLRLVLENVREFILLAIFPRGDKPQWIGREVSCRGDPVLRGVLAHVRGSFLGATEGSVIAGGRSKKGAEWLPLRPFGGDGELYAVAQHGNGERKLVFSSSRVLTTAVN